jgi:hypothetical protein
VVTAEMNMLFDRGVFSLPAGSRRAGQKPRLKSVVRE